MHQLAPDDEAAWPALADRWSLAPGVAHLNHGSFGPPPREVVAAREKWLAELVRNPMDFFNRRLDPLLAAARQRVGQFIGCPGDDLTFVENSTVAMNIVAASVPLAAGDEVLLTDHEYGAVMRIWERACGRSGARVVVAPLACPAKSADAWVDALFAHVTPRTRLLVFSHITSPTAIVLPAEAICGRARELGLPVCIDGPHALAMRDVDVTRLDCDYYAASCHKWFCGPIGSGFLYVHPRAQATLQPVVTSWGRMPAGEAASWRDEFVWAGTRDPSSYLAVPTAIDFLEAIGLTAYRQRTHRLAQYARQQVSQLTGLPPLTPDSPDWYGSMAAVPLPSGEAAPLQDELWTRHAIEVPIVAWQGQRLVRVSCQLYTRIEDIDRLVRALGELL
jgi:isopenicillin-N epimerase